MPRRHVAAIAGGVASVLVAGALAGAVNLGILRAAGSPKGPGRLSDTAVSPVVRATVGLDVPTPGQGVVSGGDETTPEQENADD
jgi:hypothetical protein